MVTAYLASEPKVHAKIQVKVKNFAPTINETEVSLNMKSDKVKNYILADNIVKKQLKVSGKGIKKVVYTSSNKKVATVSKTGLIKAVGGGYAKVTAKVVSKSGATKKLTTKVYVRNERKVVTKALKRSHANYTFDYSDEINKAEVNYKSTEFTTPTKEETAGISVADEHGATGVQLVSGRDSDTDFYLNTFIAGNKLEVTVPDGAMVTSKKADGSEEKISVKGSVASVELEPLSTKADDSSEQTIEVVVGEKTYTIHTRNEDMPNITTYGKAEDGVYTFSIDHFMLRANAKHEIIYYRSLHCVQEHSGQPLMAENFRAQDVDGERYYSYFAELDSAKRNYRGGYSSGMYVVLDKNYKEISYATLQKNTSKNHKHGEGYLDQHEFNLLGKNHWVAVSYTQYKVDNIPSSVATKNGSGVGYVQACIIQEVKDGKVVQEINSTDYPMLYETAMEQCDYVHSTDKPVEVTLLGSGEDGISYSEGYKDYIHLNSISIDPNDGNYIVSMRNQYAVYKFNRDTGDIMWTLSGMNDDFGLTADEKFIAQHYAYFEPADVAGSNYVLSVFDNYTNYKECETRLAEMTFADANETSIVNKKYYDGASFDEKSATLGVEPVFNPVTKQPTLPMHWSTHCGSVERHSQDSMTVGWGINAIYSGIGGLPLVPVASEINPNTEELLYEIYATRNENYISYDHRYSYRVYWTAS